MKRDQLRGIVSILDNAIASETSAYHRRILGNIRRECAHELRMVDVYGLSDFQLAQLRLIAMASNFMHFVTVDNDFIKTFSRTTPGPLAVLWYDTSGNLRLTTIGKRRILRDIMA